LVSNAGICPFHTFLDMPDDLFLKTQQVNFHGSFFITRAIANQMAKQEGEHRGGAIVAISSISAFFGGIQQTHYTPTKAAIKSLMESTSLALAPHGIRCNSILPGEYVAGSVFFCVAERHKLIRRCHLFRPGTIETPINEDDLQGPKRKMMEERIPLGRFGRPEDIAEPVCFMASDMAKYSRPNWAPRSIAVHQLMLPFHPHSHRCFLAR
jgi:L-rhamnose 1-dehydrogenase